MALLHKAFSIIKEHKKAYIVLNVVFYGLVLIGMVAAAFIPELRTHTNLGVAQSLSQPGLMAVVKEAYGNGHLLTAIGLTFAVNLAVALCQTTLPSFVIPFVGMLVTLCRAVLWGFIFSPTGADRATLTPHSLTLLIEGQAYVLAAFAAYVQGRMLLWPSRYGRASRWAGYKAGVSSTARLYVLVTLALLVDAIYEAIEVIYLMPRF